MKTKNRYLLIILILAFLILGYYLGLLRPLKELVVNSGNFLGVKLYKTTRVSQEIKNFFKERSELEYENSRLKKQIERLLKEKSGLIKFAQENKILREELNFLAKKEISYVSAEISGRDGKDRGMFFINRGKQDGIKENFPVIAGEGFLIGKIIEANDKNAKFLSVLSNQSRVSAGLAGYQSAQGVIEGKHNLGMVLQMIPKDIAIEPGTMVFTAGLEKDIPRGLPIGEIEKIEQKPESLFQTAQVRPIINIEDYYLVNVLLPWL